MKRTLLPLFFFFTGVFFFACDEDNDWDPDNYVVMTLHSEKPFYHFLDGKAYSNNEMPSDIDEYGIINEPWCTDLPALCGNFEVTNENDFGELESVPAGSYNSTCEEVPLNKVLVFKLGDDSYALVKIVDDVFSSDNNACEHSVTLHINYPALTNIESDEDNEEDISEGTWSMATETTGQVTLALSSFSKYGSGVYVGGRVPSSSYAAHVGEVRFEMNSYLREINTPGYFNATDIECRNESQINVCGQYGEFARYNNLTNQWEYDVKISNNSVSAHSLSFPSDDKGYVASDKELYRTYDGGQSWTKVAGFEDASAMFFITESIGYVLKENGNDEGRIYKTTNSGTDFTPYAFPMHWYGQPSVNHASAIFFIDEDNGWISADFGQIIATTNGGENWQIVRDGGKDEPHLYDIEFTSEHEGWACGANGTILRTTDGGESWSKVNVGETGDFVALEFNGPYCGWAATSNKIYFYEDWEHYSNYFN